MRASGIEKAMRVHEIVLDWSSEGAGAVSEDIGNLIADSVADGWRGRDIRVRHAIAATGAAKFCWLAR